jgi:hypothetical protein
MDAKPMGPTIVVATRLTREDAVRIQRLAAADDRPTGAYIRRLVTQHLRRLEPAAD